MEYVKSPPPDRHTKQPKLKTPKGGWDTHFHLFGPQARFPLHPQRKLEVQDCTMDDLISMHNAIGISRGLIVQSFQHGHTYEYLLHALMKHPDRFKACMIPSADITDGELNILAKAGVVATRNAFAGSPLIDEDLRKRCLEHGIGSHYLLHGEKEIAAWRPQILATKGKFVIEHMGYPHIENGLNDPCYRFLLECLNTGRCWVKLSPRCSSQATVPFSDVTPFVHDLIKRHPKRLLWGSDWPHPNYFKPMPNDADLLDLLLEWVPDEQVRDDILIHNPNELFEA
ncbi:MAG: amidohydrolase family protein [Betaproteobacteria bacterium]